MKKIATSVGLMALGAACVQAADESYSSAEAGKIWNVSASLRGFYDDNINSTEFNKVGSFGFSIIPGFNVNWKNDMNSLIVGYTYGLNYYDKPQSGNGDKHYNQNQTFNGEFNHTFNERLRAKVADTFVIGQEPGRLPVGNVVSTTQYLPGNNIVNQGAVVVNAELTPLFGLEAGYDNGFYDYAQSGYGVIPATTNSVLGVVSSQSGTSDRIEQTFHLDGRWAFTPQTTAILGYQYGMASYTGNEPISGTGITNSQVLLYSNSRNSHSHYGYVGADHTFNPDLQGSARVGVRAIDYYNTDQSQLSPYVKLSAVYGYAPESYLQGGFSFDENSTDNVSYSAANGITKGQETATVYATLHHRIVPKLFGNLNAQYQHSTYIGGADADKASDYFMLGLSLQYEFARHFSADIGYNYTSNNSGALANPSYNRNYCYIGVTGSY